MDDPTFCIARKEICPMCHKETNWSKMIWLEGQCTCPDCYKIKRAELDRKLHPEEEGT